MIRLFIIAVNLVALIHGRPGGGFSIEKSYSTGAEVGGPPPLFTFDKGGIGVNFLGFKAGAGLGGLLTGNAADGGLHSYAGTPYGQQAGAGLGGTVNGQTAGALYAGATAGNGVSAGAGLAGTAGEGGVSYAGSSAGGAATHISKVSQKSKVSPHGHFKSSFHATVAAAPPVIVDKHVDIVEQPYVVVNKPVKTYVEKTVIPQYEEKIIQVPSYVEKTIRVPTTIEKKIRVPIAPKIIEQTVEVPEVETGFEAGYEAPIVVEKIKYHHHRPHYHFRKRLRLGGGGYYGGGGNYVAAGGVGAGADGQFFNDVFNIPISTLGAVNKFLGGLGSFGGGIGGSVGVSKSIHASV